MPDTGARDAGALMGLVLYDNAASSNAMKVRYLLAEIGEAYERRRVPLARPRPAEYRERYPFATIPYLEEGDLRLGESNAILRYLARSRGREDLYPPDARGAAAVDWALDAWSTQFRGRLYPAELAGLMHADMEQGGGSVEDADQDALAAALEGARTCFELMERFVADNGTVLGTFTIADCAYAPVLWRWYRLPLSFERWPKVALLRDTVSARPALEGAGWVA